MRKVISVVSGFLFLFLFSFRGEGGGDLTYVGDLLFTLLTLKRCGGG